MVQSQAREIVGVLGGMGPLASAEFLKTIYEHTLLDDHEQDSPTDPIKMNPDVSGLIQLHLIAKHLKHDGLDPFSIIAQRLAEKGS